MWTYKVFKTRQLAEQYLESCYAEGTISPYEVEGIYRRTTGYWHLMLKS